MFLYLAKCPCFYLFWKYKTIQPNIPLKIKEKLIVFLFIEIQKNRHRNFCLKISPKKIVIETFVWKFCRKKSSSKILFENFAKKNRHRNFFLKISPKKIVIENFVWKFRRKKSSLKILSENFAEKNHGKVKNIVKIVVDVNMADRNHIVRIVVE